MKRFKNILVILDWHKENSMLIDRGLNLAKQNKSALSFVLLFEGPDFNEKDGSPFEKKMNALYQRGINKSVELVEETVNSRNSVGLKFKVTALQENLAVQIINKVVEENIDLAMLSVTPNEEESGPLLSGLPMRLMRKCPCAVWAMHPTPTGGFDRVVAAVDPRDQSEEACALNRKIMELAASVAKSEASELHVLHAWSLAGEEDLRGSIDDQDLNDWLDREKEKSVRYLSALLKPFEEDVARVHIHKGPADGLLPLFIKHFKADLLVMGTVSRTGISRFLIGNTAEKILLKVDCSVLTVKPDNFNFQGLQG